MDEAPAPPCWCLVMSGYLRVFLPVPPSTNALYRNVGGKGRVKTQAYRDWINGAGAVLNVEARKAKWKRLGGPAYVMLTIPRENKRRDLDNFVKPTLDLLSKCLVWNDDRQLETLVVRFVEPGLLPGGELLVRVGAEGATTWDTKS